MKTIKLALLPSLFLIALPACTNKIVKTEELRQVKKVAIIGLDLQQQKSVSGGDLLSLALKTNDANQATPRMRTEAQHAELVYNDLRAKVEQGTGWKVVTLAELAKSPAYAKFFKEKTEGLQNRPLINNRYDLFAPKGILDSWALMTTKTERLKELANELKVDAVIYATSTVNLNNSSMLASMVGKGEFRPSANVSLFVADARTGEKIFMASVEGPKVDKGAKNAVGMADVDQLNMLAHQATGMSLDLVMKDLTLKR